MQVKSGKGFSLDVSLFEHLIQEGISYQALKQQHRMRPEISALVQDLAYPDLTDGPGTADRGNIAGLRRGRAAFMITHSWPEGSETSAGVAVAESASKTNPQEAAMVVAVLQYLLQQGYRAANFVVLTPYLGQLRVLRKLLRDKGVDDFVGARDEKELADAGLADEQVRRELHLTQLASSPALHNL
jgi:superfamily I DNA and/or RNA helicase